MMAVLWDDPFTLLWRRTLVFSLLLLLMGVARTFGDETFSGEVIILYYQLLHRFGEQTGFNVQNCLLVW